MLTVNENENNEDEKEKETYKISYFTLFRYATKLDRVLIILGILCILVAGCAQPAVVLLYGDIMQEIILHVMAMRNATGIVKTSLEEDLFARVNTFVIWMTIIGFLTLFTTYVSSALLSYSAIRQITKIRVKFLDKILHLDIKWHDLNQTGDFATSFTENLSKIEEGIGEKISFFMFCVSVLVASVITAFIKGWKLTLICLISFPVTIVFMGLMTWLTGKFSKSELEAYSSAGAVAEEVFSSIRTVVAFGGQNKEQDRYSHYLIKAKNNNILRAVFSGINQALMWFLVFASYSLAFWVGVGFIIDESSLPPQDRVYTPGNMITVFFGVLTGTWHFGQAAPLIEVFGVAKQAAVKIFSILDTESEINKSLDSGLKLDTIKGDIWFENIYFQYPSRPDVKVLRGFDLKITSGEVVALVGSSGCGKSTCIQLMQRFYDPSEGIVHLDGYDIRTLCLSRLRDHIGVVGQEPALFCTTIAENIRFGRVNATQDDIVRAARRANAHVFIQALPCGYETIVGERGSQLSGGQKQRIAIARALIREPRVLLLDEATSALDTTSEAEVQAAIDKISGECTTIIVAHRLSTIRNANRIVVVSEGKVIEQGSHSELMTLKGAYYNLVHSGDHEDELELEDDVEITDVESNKLPTKRRLSRKLTLKEVQKEIEEDREEVEEPAKTSFLNVLKASRPEWMFILVGCLSSMLIGSAFPIYGLVFGKIIGVFAEEDSNTMRDKTNLYCLYFLIIGIVTAVATVAQTYSFSMSGEKLTLRLRRQVFGSMLNQEMGWFDKKSNGVGALCAFLSGEAGSVQGASGTTIGTILNSVTTFIVANILALYYQWKLALVLMCFVPLVLFSIFFEQRIRDSDAQTNQKALEGAAKLAVEAISNIRTVTSLGCERTFCDKFIKEMAPYLNLAKKRLHFRGIIVGLARSIWCFANGAGIFYGVKLITSEGMDFELIFLEIQVVMAGSWSVGQAFAFSPNFQKGLIAAGRIFKLLARVPLIRDIPNPSIEPWNESRVDYSNISFSYPTRPGVPVLQGLNLKVAAGKTVALVGSSGCGKSTIVQLLERFYDPTSGMVSVDGRDIQVNQLATLRHRIGVVQQEPVLFDRTIGENIAYGDNERAVDMTEVIEAAKMSNVHEFVTSLPQGYDTKLGSKGAQLSGGQKQRIAIARALVRKPSILLLDEATSALDNESEKIVQEALDRAKLGRTCITIAHRLTTIQDADLICVVKEGVIAEMGTHNELLEKQGLYFEFYKLQSGHKP